MGNNHCEEGGGWEELAGASRKPGLGGRQTVSQVWFLRVDLGHRVRLDVGTEERRPEKTVLTGKLMNLQPATPLTCCCLTAETNQSDLS